MAFPWPRVLAWGKTAALLLLAVLYLVRPAAAAEVVVDSVKPAEATATVMRYGLTRDDVQRISKTLPGVQRMVPVRTMPVRALHGDRGLSLELVGTVAEYGELAELTLQRGRFLLPKDVDNRNNIAVVDAITAQRLFPDGQAIGKSIRISSHYFLIVGVLAPKSNAASERRETSLAGCAFIPLTTMRSRYGDTVIQTRSGGVQMDRYELSRIHVVMATAMNREQAAAAIEALLKQQHEQQDYSVRAVGTSARK